MHALIVTFALTQAARKTWLDQSDELSRLGLVVPAVCLSAFTAFAFGPILDLQQQVVDKISAGVNFGD